MVRLIVGNKGKGKTTEILAKANNSIKEATGSVVYLDKSSKHMYDLHRNIRLIDVSRFPIAPFPDCEQRTVRWLCMRYYFPGSRSAGNVSRRFSQMHEAR